MEKNPLIDAIDNASTADDLMKIDKMIKTYETQGILDRDAAIKTIKKLIRANENIGREHSYEMLLAGNNWTAWEDIATPYLVEELKKQRAILLAELAIGTED